MSSSPLILLVLGLTMPGIRGQINALASVLEFVESEEGRMTSQVLERPTESKWDARDILRILSKVLINNLN